MFKEADSRFVKFFLSVRNQTPADETNQNFDRSGQNWGDTGEGISDKINDQQIGFL